ncbi:MAG: hypothetical protein HQ402_02575 [Parcubacteria group bacterium]|nr:hypothetical protein [Parcubacteria group bacterium]
MGKIFLKSIIVSILTWEARLVLKKFKPNIVAVTGSVGKTTTKDAIYAVLSSTYHTRKSEKSFNSELGVPLTILGCPSGWNNLFLWIKNIFVGLYIIIFSRKYPKWLVLEVGADRPGDIEKITHWIKPDVTVITRFSKVPVHVEFFPSPEAVIKEKLFLARALKRDGILIVNGDDPDALSFKNEHGGATIIYGENGNANLIASNYNIIYEKKGNIEVPSGINFKVDYSGNSVPIFIHGSVGHQHVYTILAAIGVGISQNLNIVKMADALGKYRPPVGRMKLVEGIKNSMIIDDTYNSSPVALAKAFETIKQINTTGRKIAILGDMLELGKYSMDEHKNAGKLVGEICDILITVGIRARYFAEGALNAGMDEKNIFQFDDPREAGKHLENIIEKGDVILAKGSQGARMERAVEEVIAHPELKENLLVRQDKEWQKR